jgi:crossover junction endodeoxyribonuclease RuvC
MVPVIDYAPTRVKNVLTGSGRATKEQVQLSVASQLRLPEPPHPDDVADAFALAICHALVANMPTVAAAR